MRGTPSGSRERNGGAGKASGRGQGGDLRRNDLAWPERNAGTRNFVGISSVPARVEFNDEDERGRAKAGAVSMSSTSRDSKREEKRKERQREPRWKQWMEGMRAASL